MDCVCQKKKERMDSFLKIVCQTLFFLIIYVFDHLDNFSQKDYKTLTWLKKNKLLLLLFILKLWCEFEK